MNRVTRILPGLVLLLSHRLTSVAVAESAAADPRPHILVIGDTQTIPGKSGQLAWPAALERRRPEWRIETRATAGMRWLPAKDGGGEHLAGRVSDMIKGMDSAPTLVLVALGLNDLRVGGRLDEAGYDPKEDVARALTALRGQETFAGVPVALVSPFPVAADRLDTWSVASFSNASTRLSRLLPALAAAAEAAKCGWIDVSGDGALPLIGRTGWLVGDGDVAAKALEDRVAGLAPAPKDAAGFEKWKAERAAEKRLDEILSATGGGEPACGPELVVQGKAEQSAALTVEVPADLLSGPVVAFVVAPATNQPLAVFLGLSSAADGRPVLNVPVDGTGTVSIALRPGEAALLDEEKPDRVSSGGRFGINQGKWNPVTVVRGEPGRRLWYVMRFSLADLRGRKPSRTASLRMMIPHNLGAIQEMTDGTPGPNIGPFGLIRICALDEPDSKFDGTSATWATRSADLRWAGGKINATARTNALSEFVAAFPGAKASQRARAVIVNLSSK